MAAWSVSQWSEHPLSGRTGASRGLGSTERRLGMRGRRAALNTGKELVKVSFWANMLVGVEEANQPYCSHLRRTTFIHHCQLYDDISRCLLMGHSEEDKWRLQRPPHTLIHSILHTGWLWQEKGCSRADLEAKRHWWLLTGTLCTSDWRLRIKMCRVKLFSGFRGNRIVKLGQTS